ncbi:uncharacterized protein DUF2809 [Mucilaginibacter yixingensis]|uniref:Uncharacterized protein DUF2809 n=2 Tax=Mucilaginibacter yixingensis TaxID=1295612 RepID=A0A2T5J6E5_9SPHI|nr:uncharacterized protein DUF2809 [Mucilaginibacter yixingensis]
MFRFSPRFFSWTLVLFAVEAMIAAFAHDDFVRPVLGDFFVVMLIYCAIKSFFKIPYGWLGLGVLLFAYAVETSQYYHLIYNLELQNSTTAKLILGTGFSWGDIKAYTWGIFVMMVLEWSQTGKKVPAKTAMY